MTETWVKATGYFQIFTQQMLGENEIIKLLVRLGNTFTTESEVAEMICTALG